MLLFFCSRSICPKAIAAKFVRGNYAAGCAVSCSWWIRNWCGSNINRNRTDSTPPKLSLLPDAVFSRPETRYRIFLTCVRAPTHTHTHTHTHARRHTRTRTHAHIHTHNHAHARTRTHAQKESFVLKHAAKYDSLQALKKLYHSASSCYMS